MVAEFKKYEDWKPGSDDPESGGLQEQQGIEALKPEELRYIHECNERIEKEIAKGKSFTQIEFETTDEQNIPSDRKIGLKQAKGIFAGALVRQKEVSIIRSHIGIHDLLQEIDKQEIGYGDQTRATEIRIGFDKNFVKFVNDEKKVAERLGLNIRALEEMIDVYQFCQWKKDNQKLDELTNGKPEEMIPEIKDLIDKKRKVCQDAIDEFKAREIFSREG